MIPREKIHIKHVAYVDLKTSMTFLVLLSLVVFVDADGLALERSDNTGTPPDRFLVKKYT